MGKDGDEGAMVRRHMAWGGVERSLAHGCCLSRRFGDEWKGTMMVGVTRTPRTHATSHAPRPATDEYVGAFSWQCNCAGGTAEC